jgi:hypothetical protein
MQKEIGFALAKGASKMGVVLTVSGLDLPEIIKAATSLIVAIQTLLSIIKTVKNGSSNNRENTHRTNRHK